MYRMEVIEQLGPWYSMVAVEIAPLGWVDWFNNRRFSGADRVHPTGRVRRSV